MKYYSNGCDMEKAVLKHLTIGHLMKMQSDVSSIAFCLYRFWKLARFVQKVQTAILFLFWI